MCEDPERPLYGVKNIPYMTVFDIKKTFQLQNIFFTNFVIINLGSGSGLDPYSATGWIRIQQNTWI
jgi:hypothetical protein